MFIEISTDNINYQLKKLLYKAIILTLFSFVFYGCDNEPIIPPEENTTGFDSARYDFEIDTFYQTLRDIGSADTNLFVLSLNSLMTFDGINYINHPIPDPSFGPTFLGVVNKDLVYIGGGSSIPNPKTITLFMNWVVL